jgi:hypothetical protein
LIIRTKSWSCILLLMLGSIATMLSTTAASAECQEFKKKTDEYKRCLAYLRMAGTPRQREGAEDQVKKDKANKRCAWHPNDKDKNRFWVCDDYKTRSERRREEAQKRADKGIDDKPLKPIIIENSGAFGAPKPPSKPAAAAPCPPNHVLSRNGACVASIQCRPGHTVSPITGQCVVGCRPGHVLSPSTGQCVAGCRPGHVPSTTGRCVPA